MSSGPKTKCTCTPSDNHCSCMKDSGDSFASSVTRNLQVITSPTAQPGVPVKSPQTVRLSDSNGQLASGIAQFVAPGAIQLSPENSNLSRFVAPTPTLVPTVSWPMSSSSVGSLHALPRSLVAVFGPPPPEALRNSPNSLVNLGPAVVSSPRNTASLPLAERAPRWFGAYTLLGNSRIAGAIPRGLVGVRIANIMPSLSPTTPSQSGDGWLFEDKPPAGADKKMNCPEKDDKFGDLVDGTCGNIEGFGWTCVCRYRSAEGKDCYVVLFDNKSKDRIEVCGGDTHAENGVKIIVFVGQGNVTSSAGVSAGMPVFICIFEVDKGVDCTPPWIYQFEHHGLSLSLLKSGEIPVEEDDEKWKPDGEQPMNLPLPPKGAVAWGQDFPLTTSSRELKDLLDGVPPAEGSVLRSKKWLRTWWGCGEKPLGYYEWCCEITAKVDTVNGKSFWGPWQVAEKPECKPKSHPVSDDPAQGKEAATKSTEKLKSK
jgi:hypothetical protein